MGRRDDSHASAESRENRAGNNELKVRFLEIGLLMKREPDRSTHSQNTSGQRAASGPLWLWIVLALAGGVGLAFTAGYAPSNLLASAAPFAPVVLALLALVWIAPAIVRRRK